MFGTSAFRALIEMTPEERAVFRESGMCRCRLCSDRRRPFAYVDQFRSDGTPVIKDPEACFHCQPCPTPGCPFCPRHECGKTGQPACELEELIQKAQELELIQKELKAQALVLKAEALELRARALELKAQGIEMEALRPVGHVHRDIDRVFLAL
jgi:hypothetical protein